jgi:excinuclease ABC subunit A
MTNNIFVKGAREHNLKNIDVKIPRDRLVVITGLSGSGKSTLAFDTIYSEGQRRYVESLSAYARQFLEQMKKPNVDYIEGLSPAISIDQKTTSKNPRSTVGTVTEIHDYLRLLYARIGIPHCPVCGKKIQRQTVGQIADQVLKLSEGTKIQVLSPIVRDRKGEYRTMFRELKKEGFARVFVDGELYDLDEPPALEKYVKHTIEVVVDRLIIKDKVRGRLVDSLDTAMQRAEGTVVVDSKEGRKTYSEHFACSTCGISFEELQPRMFSFNSPHGACPTCQGLGTKQIFDPDLVIPDKTKSIMEGAIAPWETQVHGWRGYYLRSLGEHYDFDLETPIKDISEDHVNTILYGSSENIQYNYHARTTDAHYHWSGDFEGVIPNMERLYKQTESEYRRSQMERYITVLPCPECAGKRLKPTSLAVTVGRKSIADVSALSVKDFFDFIEKIKLSKKDKIIAENVLKEIKERLNFLINVGLDYLTLDRAAGTLSGGEAQRIRLATQIGSGLVGVLYILDEPSIGLHQRDNRRLIETLKRLRDLGNTVIIVEHDEETMRAADHVIDMGPGAGDHGGEVVVQGTFDKIIRSRNSITGKYLKGALKIDVPEERRQSNGHSLTLKGASHNNLKKLDVNIPLGIFICITGVSGSGKSSLVGDTLYPALSRHFYKSRTKPGEFEELAGLENIDKVINIDQSPIGRTPRSNPATYTNVFTPIRELYSKLPESRKRGYKPGRFSFNVKGGRCEACRGDGIIKIEMHFLPDVYVPCEECKGARYNPETLEVSYKGKTISDVLDMTVEEALAFFKNVPQIKRKLQTIYDVGLGYIKLGQPAPTLSGGEAQRVKLSTELSKRSTGRTLYLLDEPTTGLHFDDIKKLLSVLGRLTDSGNTVVVIEHNLDVIKTADWIIDLGPEGGDEGGQIVAEGTPEAVAKNKKSYTGKFLKGILKSC